MFSEHWPGTSDGDPFRVIKVSPEGEAVTEYPATVSIAYSHGPWICLQATWTFKEIDVDGLIFTPGDTLLEWFSREHWYNVFAVYSPDGEYRGSYANVTYPAHYDPQTNPPSLAWHDLYLDVILRPARSAVVRDEDELEESGLAATDPALHRQILDGCAALLEHVRAGDPPFAGLLATDESEFQNRTYRPVDRIPTR